MSIDKRLFVMTRFCTNCRGPKPIRGSKTYPKFVCADCIKAKSKEA